MKIVKSITITLSENDVKTIVAEHLKNEGYSVDVDKVILSVGNKWVGYGMDEHQVPYFKECTVSLDA